MILFLKMWFDAPIIRDSWKLEVLLVNS
jgi:hypothetical protein